MGLQIRDLVNLRASLTPDSLAYADHDQVGTLITFSSVFSQSTRKGLVESVSLVDSTTQAAALTVHFFRSAPTVASSDNAALNIADADLATDWIGKVELPAASYQSVTTASVVSVTTNLVVDSTDENLYAIIESAGTPTYGASATLTLIVGMSRG